MALNIYNRVSPGHKLLWMLAVGIATTGCFWQSALAVPLVPGMEDVLAVGEPDPTGGVVVAGGVPVPFVALTFSGTLTSTVIAGDPSNPYGGLTFTYQIANDPGSPNAINRLTIQDAELPAFLTDVSYQTPAAGVIPTLMGRPTADVIGWTWIAPILGSGVILPGTSSAVVVMQTNASYWKPIVANVIDGSTANPSSFGPAVPEPGTFALASVGGVGLILAWRRRKRR